MEFLNQVAIVFLLAISPLIGRFLHSVAPKEVEYGRRYLTGAMLASLALGLSHLRFGLLLPWVGFFDAVGLVVISGIICGSLFPKKNQLWGACAVFLILGGIIIF